MRVDAGISYPYINQRPQPLTTDSSASTSFSTELTTAQADNTKVKGSNQVDFTNMFNQEMLDWVNGEIRSGEMSLDDGRPFMAMAMKVPVDGDIQANADNTRYDFTQKVRDGIQGALSRNDETTLNMLESAMQTIQKYQIQENSIDVLA